MSKDMTKDELLKHLNFWYLIDSVAQEKGWNIPFTDTKHEDCEQAYNQLVKIVEQHFKDAEIKTEVLAQEYEQGLKHGYEHAKKEQSPDKLKSAQQNRLKEIPDSEQGNLSPINAQKTDSEEGEVDVPDFKLAKSRLKAILDNLIDSGYSQADALKDILYVIKDLQSKPIEMDEEK